MKNLARLICITTLIIMVAACSSVAPVTTPASQAGQTPDASSYPYPSANPSGYPAAMVEPAPVNPYPAAGYPSPTQAATMPTATVSSKMGMINGRLINNGKPLNKQGLFLAAIAKNPQTGQDLVAKFSAATSPYAETDTEGNFIFVNIPPGKYGLILYTVVESYLLADPKGSGQPVYVTVAEGQTINLGELKYDNLPKLP
jgi:hypothetical protein